jgi:plasmid replication initiation protein
MFVFYIISKKDCAVLIIPHKENYVTKSEKLLQARYDLNELSIKLIAILYSNVKRSDEVGKDYEIKIIDIAKLLNRNYGELYNEIKDSIEELMSKPVFIPDEDNSKNYIAFNWIADARYKDGIITFTISKRLKPFVLDLQQRFLKYKLENILPLKSKYVIRLYEILKDWLELNNRYGNKTEKIVSVKEFRNMLEIPRSYQYSSHIKKLILKKAQSEFETYTDIVFDFEEIKSGRKITHLKFLIKPNPKKVKPKPKLQTQTGMNYKKDDFKTWRKRLLKKEDVILKIDNQIFEIQDGLLARDGKLLDKEEAWKAWKFLFKNKDKISLLNRDEFDKEKVEQIKYDILKAFKGKLLKAIPVKINGEIEYINAYVVGIKDFKDLDKFTAVLKSGKKFFEMRTSLNDLNNFLKT